MKKLKYLLFISLVSLSVVLFVSCGDDDDNNGECCENEKMIPEKMVSSEGETIEFKYDSQKRLVAIVSTHSDGDKDIDSTYYDTQNRVIKHVEINYWKDNNVEKSERYEENFTYNSNGTITGEFSGEGASESRTYVIDENACLTDNWESASYVYDSKKRLIKELDGSYSATYEYDDKHGIFENVVTPKWYLLAFVDDDYLPINWLNNARKKTSIDGSDQEIETYSYTYNQTGYPSKVEVTAYDGDKTSYVLTYIKID